MKLLKTAIATSILATMIAPVQAETDVYGKVNVSVQNSDNGEGSYSELKSNSSRFGLKGSTQLDNGMKLVYKYEFQVDIADESGADNLKSRNQYLGLTGGFGEVLLGRNDTMLKQSQGKVDLFSDFNGDMKNIAGKAFKGENRMSNTVSYKTPKFNDVQFGLTYVLPDEKDGDAATSFSAVYGDKALKKGNWYAGLAYDSEMKGYDATRLTVGTKVSDIKLGFMYQIQEQVDSDDEMSSALVSAAYTIGKNTLKAQYQTFEDDTAYSVGVDHKLGKNSKAYVWYTGQNRDTAEDESYLAIGLVHSF